MYLFLLTSLHFVVPRETGKVVQQYRGAEGSIRSIRCHSTEPVVAACGLDRFVRVYDIDSRQLLHKVRRSFFTVCFRQDIVILFRLQFDFVTRCMLVGRGVHWVHISK